MNLRAALLFARSPNTSRMQAVTASLLLLALIVLSFTQPAAADVRATGLAYAVGSQEMLYSETFTRLTDTEERVDYRDMTGKLIAEKHLFYGANTWAPEFDQFDLRLGEKITVRRGDGVLIAGYQHGEQNSFRSTVIDDAPMLVIDAGFDGFVRAHWQRVMLGKKLDLAFLLPTRGRTIVLKIHSVDALNFNFPQPLEDDSVLFVRIAPAGWLMRVVVDPIELAYDITSRRLLAFRDISNLRNDDGVSQQVEIYYRYPDTPSNSQLARQTTTF